jgi:queuine tRNA-ribosyltransferase
MYDNFKFKIIHRSTKSKARSGGIRTPHGEIVTPAFIFCGTKAVMKGCTMEQMEECNAQVVLSNTYHLFVQPGSDKIKQMGGLHKCSGWKGPLLTDSGGYQIFAMGYGSVSNDIGEGSKNEIKGNQYSSWKPTLISVDDNGAKFSSYHDQSVKILTPEKSIQIQNDLGADIILVLDECTPFNVSKEYTEQSMHRSHRWADRSLAEFKKNNNQTQALYGIVQGSVYEDLRQISIDYNNENDFFGIAIGGSLGDCKETMYNTVDYIMDRIRSDRPIHLLGIGHVCDIFNGVRQGIDTFDCVHPTRIARHGNALVKAQFWIDNDPSVKGKEHIDLSKSRYIDNNVIDSDCSCPTCKDGNGYSKMYLNYLFKIKESTAGVLVTLHNVHFMNELMSDIRVAICNDTLDDIEKQWVY